MNFYFPGKKFPALSVTGTHCALNCPHCQGHYLESMIQTETPEKIVSFCCDLEDAGGIGCLISGGCNTRGQVPLPMEALRQVRETTQLLLNVHTGFIDKDMATALNAVEPHYISLDIPTPTVLHAIYRVDHTPEEYLHGLALTEGLTVVPHVMVGLDAAEECATLELLSEREVNTVVLIVCTPTRQTPSEHWPVSVDAVIQVFNHARPLFSRLVLGCMRPRLQVLEEQAPLFDAVAVPTPWAKKAVHAAGIQPETQETCCVVL